MKYQRAVRLAAVTCVGGIVLSGCGSSEWTPGDVATPEPTGATSPSPSAAPSSTEPDQPAPGEECATAVAVYVPKDNAANKVRQISDPPDLECLVTVNAGSDEESDYLFTFTQGESGSFTLVDQVPFPSTAAPAAPSPSPSSSKSEDKKPKPSAKPSKKPKASSSPSAKPSKKAAPKPTPTVTVTATPEPDETGVRAAVSGAIDAGEMIFAHVEDTGVYPSTAYRARGVSERLGSLKVKQFDLLPNKKRPTGFSLCVADPDGAWALYRSGTGLSGFGLSGATCKGNL